MPKSYTFRNFDGTSTVPSEDVKLEKAQNLTTGQLTQFGRYGPVGRKKSKSFSLQKY